MTTIKTPTRMRDRQPATVQDIKAQAGRLRKALEGSSALTHAQALEMTARMHGFDTWGELNAQLRTSEPDASLAAAATNMPPVAYTIERDDEPEIYLRRPQRASPLIESAGISMSRSVPGQDLIPKVIFGLSEVEFMSRLRWHCNEGSEGLSPSDFLLLGQVVRGIVETGVLDQPLEPPLDVVNVSTLPLTVMRDWHLGTALQWVYEKALEGLDGYDHKIHRPALQRLLELCKWGLPVPTRRVTQYAGADDLPGARRGWEPPFWSRSANLEWITSCKHAVIFAASQDDRLDLIKAISDDIEADRHPLPVIDLHEYANEAGETQLYDTPEMRRRVPDGNLYPTTRQLSYYLKAHTGRSDLPEMDYHVDQLIYGCYRSAERRMSVRAPLVAALQWRPHDGHLPFMLPRLRDENVFIVSMVSPANYMPSELRHLRDLMDNSGVWVLAPGAALPPVEGIERVRNDTRKPLMLRR